MKLVMRATKHFFSTISFRYKSQGQVPWLFSHAWEQRKLNEVFSPLQNNTYSRADLNYENGVVRNVHYGDVLINFGECLDASEMALPFISDDQAAAKYKASYLQDGDVIIADTAEDETVGKCTEIKGIEDTSIVSGLHTIPCRPIIQFATSYLGYYMNSNTYHDQLLPLIQGTKISSISKTALQNTDIVYPSSIKEQGYIGTFFDNLNNLIALHQRKLEKAKEFKKSCLVEMFPAEGQRKPKRRFPGFTDDWEQRKLGDIAEIISGGTPDTNNPDYWDGDINWYAPAEISDQIHVVESERKITDRSAKKFCKNASS